VEDLVDEALLFVEANGPFAEMGVNDGGRHRASPVKGAP